jgi:ABC-type cobalt transport system, ATPase component
MTLVAEYCQRVVAFRDGELSFAGTPDQLFGDEQVLQQTGLRAPTAVALSAYLRRQRPDFPLLLTVAQWKEALTH